VLTSSLDYHLPPERIATAPAQPRDAARLLVFDRRRDVIEHLLVRDLPQVLGATDALVFNTTAVMAARLILARASGHRTEGLALEALPGEPTVWRFLIRSAGRLRAGERLALIDGTGIERGDAILLLRRDAESWVGRLMEGDEVPSAAAVDAWFLRSGHVPLPPYILRARLRRGEQEEQGADRGWYQTAFADLARRRSVAAPTAGLHFTPELLTALTARGVRRIDLLLHVGAGTFKPIEAKTLESHAMHAEHYEVSGEALELLRAQRAGGGRIIAVGTTTVRTLESLADPLPVDPQVGQTRLLIAPGHPIRHVDALLTNFHLPRSTLLALVAAFTGLERLMSIYREAIDRGYRFYSYGDAMLVL
jgi:S-adenosylmethionine:tRNA ribosyltransferase-isomerase